MSSSQSREFSNADSNQVEVVFHLVFDHLIRPIRGSDSWWAEANCDFELANLPLWQWDYSSSALGCSVFHHRIRTVLLRSHRYCRLGCPRTSFSILDHGHPKKVSNEQFSWKRISFTGQLRVKCGQVFETLKFPMCIFSQNRSLVTSQLKASNKSSPFLTPQFFRWFDNR